MNYNKLLETAPQGSRRLQSSFSKEWYPEKMVNLQKRCFEIFEYFMIFAHHCLRPPQNLVLFLEAGEGPGKPGSALKGVGGYKGHPWSAQKQSKPKSQKSIFVIFRDFREFCSLPLPSLLHRGRMGRRSTARGCFRMVTECSRDPQRA